MNLLIQFGKRKLRLFVVLLPPLIWLSFSCAENQGYSSDPIEKNHSEHVRHFTVNNLGDTVFTGIPIAAKGKRINPDSLAQPRVVPLQRSPEVLPIHHNTQAAGKPRVLKIPRELSILTPGKNGVPMPASVPVLRQAEIIGQPIPVPALPPRIKNTAYQGIQYLDVDQGMISSYLRFLLEDSHGYLWFGTSYGISRYDGCSFIHYTTEAGLIQNSSWSMLEDSRGHLWLGTTNGISRYDGHKFVHYRVEIGMSKYEVKAILEDRQGNLWFGTSGGVLLYDHPREDGSDPESFAHFTTQEGLISNGVLSILEDRQGSLWFGTIGGVCQYKPDGSFTHFTTKEGLTHNVVFSIEEDVQGKLWLGTNGGVTCYTPGVSMDDGGATFSQFTREQGLISEEVSCILQDSRENIWMASTEGVSCYRPDKLGGTFAHYRLEEGLTSNKVRIILEDSYGNIWLGTAGGGVNRLDPAGFYHFNADPTISDNGFTAMAEDRQGAIWFATGGAVIRYHLPDSNDSGENVLPHQFTYFTPREGLIDKEVLCILSDSQGNMWFGTGNGVSRFDGKNFTQFTTKEGLINNEVKSLMEDSRGNIWFITTSGVSCYTPDMDKSQGPDGPPTEPAGFTQFTKDEGLISNRVRAVLEDKRGDIWFATSEGVSRYTLPAVTQQETTTGYFTHYSIQEGLTGNDVRCMLEDRRGNIWFGTYGNGLYCYHPDQDQFARYRTSDGLSNNVIWSLQEDSLGNIWMGTEMGITLMSHPASDTSTGLEDSTALAGAKFYTFYKENGLKRLDFHANSVLLDRQNHLWWGTPFGLVNLDLNRFRLPTNPPETVQLTHIEINQQSVDFRRVFQPAYRQQLDFSEDLMQSYDSVVAFANYPVAMTLPHDLNHLTFHYSAVDWSGPEKIKYQYFMEGLDKTWSQPKRENKADYRNLPPGAYTFKVRAGGEAGIWSEPFMYSFVVRPPWWLTWWAYMWYLLLISGMIYLLFSFFKKRYMLQTALERKKEEAIRLTELDSLKTRFFTNVSHELRTPLTLLLGPVNSVLKDPQLTKKQTRLLRMAAQSGKQLEQLVNQILDLRKLEMGKMTRNETPTPLSSFFRRNFVQFESLARRKQIDFSFVIEVAKETVARIDPEKYRQILYNLLSNAFKFTPTAGRIEARVSVNDGVLQLSVSDSGSGIHPDDLPHVFDRYFQTSLPDQPAEGGTGIGLAICYEYTQLLGGEISVDSTLGEGTVFWVRLPVSLVDGQQEATPEDSPAGKIEIGPPKSETDSSELQVIGPDKKTTKNGNPLKPAILVVEDNPDLQDYIRLILEKNYEVICAENGRDALSKLLAKHQQPPVDLILSDLMMPVMDGFQLLEKLKSADATRHLPVIMLTARADLRDKLKALRIGVDDYLIKPFDEEELLVRIENLLKNQAARRPKNTSEAQTAVVKAFLSKPDQEWLESYENFVQKHLSDETLSVAKLAGEFAMSESTLLRQLKRLTGLSPNQYLLEVRFNVARQLLENRTYHSIEKIAAEVGYHDVRSFSRQFKKRFGKLPSDFLSDANSG